MAEEDPIPLPDFADSDSSSDDDIPPPMPSMFGDLGGGDDDPGELPILDEIEEGKETSDKGDGSEEDVDGLPVMPVLQAIRTTTTVSLTLDIPVEDLAFPVVLEVPEEINSDTEIGFEEDLLLNGWKLGQKLGEGSYARVVLATKDDGTSAAVKIMNKAILEKETRSAIRSRFVDGVEDMIHWTGANMLGAELLTFHKCVESEFIINLVECVEDTRTVNLCLFLEIAPLGDVMDWDPETNRFIPGEKLPDTEKVDGHFTEDASRNYFRSLICGLRDMHAKNVAHLDIKPQNLLAFEPGVAKLCDFGTCLHYDKEEPLLRGSSVGTEHFFSPGTCKSKKRSPYQDDIWGAGVTLYCFLTGRVPFWADDRPSLFDAIRHAELEFPNDVDLSDGVKELLMGILTKKEKDRMSIDDILVHPWMADHPVSGLIKS